MVQTITQRLEICVDINIDIGKVDDYTKKLSQIRKRNKGGGGGENGVQGGEGLENVLKKKTSSRGRFLGTREYVHNEFYHQQS